MHSVPVIKIIFLVAMESFVCVCIYSLMDPESPCRVNHTCNCVSDVGESLQELTLISYGFEGPGPRAGRIVASSRALDLAVEYAECSNAGV